MATNGGGNVLLLSSERPAACQPCMDFMPILCHMCRSPVIPLQPGRDLLVIHEQVGVTAVVAAGSLIHISSPLKRQCPSGEKSWMSDAGLYMLRIGQSVSLVRQFL